MTIILWHYRDLRVEDHLALEYAAKSNLSILPLYIHDDKVEDPWSIGAASKWWLHHSLTSLQKKYKELGSTLIIRKGNALDVIDKLCELNRIEEICWINRHQPKIKQRDLSIANALKTRGIKTTTFEGNYLISPVHFLNKSNAPFKIFTPFYNAALKEFEYTPPIAPPKSIKKPPKVSTLEIDDLELLPKIPWDQGIKKCWTPGRSGAEKALKEFQKDKQVLYPTLRDFPGIENTSRLSPHLSFGEISPREVWKHIVNEDFKRQLIWREFANYFLVHFPKSTNISWRESFEKFPWKTNKKLLTCWQKGLTGYPIVDAGMRQLWQTGWMHNRVRMIVGSFLIKDLMIHWIEGARWFWDTLVDADLANNTLGWQWVAGSGPDAAPYFRIFNPILQGKKFDENGDYIRKYVPELSNLPNKWIHSPWEAPGLLLQELGVTLGKDYPFPIIDHAEARKQALEAFQGIKTSIPK